MSNEYLLKGQTRHGVATEMVVIAPTLEEAKRWAELAGFRRIELTPILPARPPTEAPRTAE